MIAAIILAAGRSRRMGQPKMLLPWGKRTVIEHVITTFRSAGLENLVVVTGATHEQLEQILRPYGVRVTYNEQYETGEMLSSLQCGLRRMPDAAEAALIGLGDQPQVQERTVRLICQAYEASHSALVVPSFQMKRGHPWLVARPHWNEILAMGSSQSPRTFLERHAKDIHYLNMDTPSILADLDTPEDYRRSRP